MQPRPIAHVVSVLSCIPGQSNDEAADVLEMFVRLSDSGRLDTDPVHGQSYRVRRLVKGMEVWSGRMLGEGEAWILQSDDDDDPIWFIKFGTLRPGEYLTLHPPGRGELVFRIVSVDYATVTRPTLRTGGKRTMLHPD
jgi:hypothetical protein